ncbi:MAG TPA: cellulose biosynthesis protein BcsS [Ancylobacter sp.]
MVATAKGSVEIGREWRPTAKGACPPKSTTTPAAATVWSPSIDNAPTAKWIGPLHREGFRLRAQAGLGRYRYETSNAPGGWNTGNKLDGEILIGWQFLRGAHALAIYGGVNVTRNTLEQPDPSNRDQGTQAGAKIVVEWFYRLDDDWTLTAAAGASTADGTASLRATAGRRMHEWFDLGTEASTSTNWLSKDARFGLFIASPLPGRQLRAAGGWRWSDDSRSGPYGTLSLYAPF